MKIKNVIFWIFVVLVFAACEKKPEGNVAFVPQKPVIEPDYSGLTIPFNIAPLNFSVKEEGEAFYVELKAKNGRSVGVLVRDGNLRFPEKKWKNLLEENRNSPLEYVVYTKQEGEWKQYQSFFNTISGDSIDPFMYYRLLYPGYESWAEISIMQRSLESFKEKAVVKNNVVGQNCVNCHSFDHQNPGNFMFHMRGSLGGTYFVTEGELEKFNLKTKELENGAVYPRWHPSGKYVAFSSNKVVQQFHSLESKKIEVSDLVSSLVLYDRDKNEVMDIPVNPDKNFMDTYPEWSPDGETLYFCRAAQIEEGYDYSDIRYDLYRVCFNPKTRKFGGAELIFDAGNTGKSVSFPRVSPDGKSLVLTLHDYGCFPIWHKEADLYSINLINYTTAKLDVNSEFTESYHSWSSNGRWLVFSSKRGDGLSARPYIAYMDESGKAHKPFVLPQKDPAFYNRFLKTFNIPEFSKTEISLRPGEIRKAAGKPATQAKWSSN
jgi:Tol biopolymer transport system component